MKKNYKIDLNAMQEYLSNMFKELVSIFEKENIEYFAVGGTLIGAVRHSGFIPWDDDIDIGMKREVYEHFLNNYKDILPEYFELRGIEIETKYPHPYLKIIDKRTTLIEDSVYETVGGVFIDIFPVDYAGDNYETAVKSSKEARKLMRKLAFFTGAMKKTTSRTIFMKLFSPIVRLFFNREKITKNLIEIYKKYDSKNSKYVAVFYGSWIEKDIFESEWVTNLIKARFEDFEITITSEYDKILNRIYGDYMKLPEEAKRVSHHDVKYLNLKLGYDKYLSSKKNKI